MGTLPFISTRRVPTQVVRSDRGYRRSHGVDRNSETMGAGVVVCHSPQPDESNSFPIDGLLASLRAEAAGLDKLLDLVAQDQPLLIFTNCVTMLMILLRWGRLASDFWPGPEDVKDFDVLNFPRDGNSSLINP